MQSPVDVIILANQNNRTFWPFSGLVSLPMLPLAGKPLISCLIEILARFAPIRIGVAICPWDHETLAEATRHHWPNVTISPLLDLRADWPTAELVLRADIIPDHSAIAGQVNALREGPPVPPRKTRPYAWLKPVLSRQNGTTAADCLLPDAAAYFRMAMLAQQDCIEGLQPEGWIGDDGIRVGTGTTILTRRGPGIRVSVGSNAFIDRSVQLGDSSIVGEGAYVSHGAWLQHSIVLPNCFVPPGTKLDHSIVCKHWIYDIKSGTTKKTQNINNTSYQNIA